ncbi:HEAT repeat domain-containing protein [bacterium]|nr:MAG: HEAT repeat domain-containing protein [bacterium]
MKILTRAAALLCLCLAVFTGCNKVAPPLSLSELEAKAAAKDSSAYAGLVGYLGSASTQDERKRAYLALVGAGKSASAEIAAALEDSDPSRREHALALAGNMKLEGAVDAAYKALADTSFTRRHAAAWVLGESGDERAIPVLVRTISTDPDELAVREAARAVSRFGERATLPLVEALPSMEPRRRGTAVRILGELRDPRGKSAIVAALADPVTREDAMWALGTMGVVGDPFDPAPYLKDTDWQVRLEACRAAGLIGAKSARPILDKMRSDDPVKVVREWAARGLALLDGSHTTYRNTSGEWDAPDNLYH